MSETGKVCLVGTGPEVEVTDRGREVLAQAELVVFDPALAERVGDWARPEARRVEASSADRLARDELVENARQGKKVVRLYAGEPFLSGCGVDDARTLVRAGVAFEVVPGLVAESRPLWGRRILITRPREQAGGFAALIEELGGTPVVFPTIRIEPPDDRSSLDRAIDELGSYGWVIFTSANGVRFFAERLLHLGKDPRAFAASCRVVAIGPGTERALREALCVQADAVPEQYVAEGVLELMEGEDLLGKRVLIPRAKRAREVLPTELRRRGARVDVVEAYQTLPVPPEEVEGLRRKLSSGEVDMVAFTSSSTVQNFVELLGAEEAKALRGRVKVASIGPVTSATARELGLSPAVEAGTSTVPGLAHAIVEYYRAGRASVR